ncbi:hypothetical protein LIER_43430 [Lithospermum erythrorhizon]|uniref:Uncharacterized protein n=1 Tax=Lithospermum erythrorhizon TaxID=34254 RepID=A0AAV3Q4M0_LITER
MKIQNELTCLKHALFPANHVLGMDGHTTEAFAQGRSVGKCFTFSLLRCDPPHAADIVLPMAGPSLLPERGPPRRSWLGQLHPLNIFCALPSPVGDMQVLLQRLQGAYILGSHFSVPSPLCSHRREQLPHSPSGCPLVGLLPLFLDHEYLVVSSG